MPPKAGLLFIKEVAKYFMDFLETDFHKRKNPKRSIQHRDSSNLLIGINLNKYPSFNKLVAEAISHAFNKEVISSIGKGVYGTSVPKNLIELVNLLTKKIQKKKFKQIVQDIGLEIEKNATIQKKDFDQAVSSSLDAASQILKSELVLPFVKNLEQPLENLKLADENSIFLMEEELTSVLIRLIESKVSDVIRNILADIPVNTTTAVEEVFLLEDVQKCISTFFENFQVGDLFAELYEIERNRTILDKQELYLYFGDITYKQVKYPIFYIPLSVQNQDDRMSVEFDSQVYINKKALEFIIQEYNNEKQAKGSLKSVTERILYLAQHQNDFADLANQILSEITNVFGLDANVDIGNPDKQVARSFFLSISNSCYIALFDKSDEALVNDYEDILKLLSEEDNVLASAFNNLIGDFIYQNPKPFNPEVEAEWDSKDIGEKLVSNSPIPLNSEQLQILTAIKKDDCKYIIVEGPPGTGKSHTITAIAFDSILQNKSVLVLSDKKEALDVVEDKIVDTMNKVRHDKNFQNPLLRLGKTGSTYSQILASSTIENIKTHIRAVKKEEKAIDQDIQRLHSTIKEDIEAEVLAYSGIELDEIRELLELEKIYHDQGLSVDLEEVFKSAESVVELVELRKALQHIGAELGEKSAEKDGNDLFKLLKFSSRSIENVSSFRKYTSTFRFLLETVSTIKDAQPNLASVLVPLNGFTDKWLAALEEYVQQLRAEKNALFGYLFKGKFVEALDQGLSRNLGLSLDFIPHKNVAILQTLVSIFTFANKQREQNADGVNYDFDYLAFVFRALTDEKILNKLTSLVATSDDVDFIEQCISKYPETCKLNSITASTFASLEENKLTATSDAEFDQLIRYLTLHQKINKDFSTLPGSNYAAYKKNIEDLVTTQMTYLMDSRVIDFYEYNKTTARTLREIIKSKQRFPKEEFLKLKEAFPCILAGIRDYAEYIPLEPEMFDLVIIDEASQVSIAQAFPALLRAKKVLILGDRKQFSNVKTSQARTDTNREYLNALKESFVKNVSNESSKLVKLSKFNIKTSILEFFEFISNYNTQLLKHFRGYKEIISYSNKYFYQDSLQVMKIRGKAIDEVLKFSQIKHDGKQELSPNSNTIEADFIIEELKKLKETGSRSSVGIITPHTNQQKLLAELISKTADKDYFYDTLNLKVMTFDTCQGEERDIIYYSMVATVDDDKLWGVFIKNLADVDIEEDGKIKAQRLNVGLSRAKECMHFVLSKPVEEYSGSIGEALRHYEQVLNEAKKEHTAAEVDKKSGMEPAVLNWFYQTGFWKKHKDEVEFFPQFELGKYLKQLDRTYHHPNYQVDFLMVYRDELQKEHKIIIEYDGFREHFSDIDIVNETNYKDYYNADDVYREKVLESYGYKFIRINKFNIGKDPISTLNERIEQAVRGKVVQNPVISNIHSTIEGLQNGHMKECPKCKEVRDAEDFRDKNLVTGYGRFCRYCKGIKPTTQTRGVQKQPLILSNLTCPRCHSKMILRSGRYGKFYGCSKFPYCKGTKPYTG